MYDENNSKITIIVPQPSNKPVIPPSEPLPPKRPRRRWFKIILVLLLLIMLCLGGLLIYRTSVLGNSIFVGKKTSFLQKFRNLIGGTTGNTKLRGEDDGQINVLLLGIGGEGHDGPYLSDTIILAQIKPKDHAVAMTSIPRDYLINLPGYGYRKINAAFAEGYNKNKDFDEAGKWAREIVEKISGQTIPYFAVIDFSGFEKAIDKVGGLDITIDRTFTDYTYPDSNDGYLPAVTFKEGAEHMNGTRALIFARSRHAAGFEGSDFARSLRQQKIIKAFKEKLTSLNLISDVSTINNLATVFANHFHTNIDPGELLHLYQLTSSFSKENILATSLDPATKLICPKTLEETGAYVLTACAGKNEKDIQQFFSDSFSLGKLTAEQPKVWIAANSENSVGYQEISKSFIDNGITPLFVRNTVEQGTTTVYQINQKPGTIQFLKDRFGIMETNALPEGFNINPAKVDLVILVAQSGTSKPSK